VRSNLKERLAAPVLKGENTAVGICHTDHVWHPLSAKVGTNFADKRIIHSCTVSGKYHPEQIV
jgi:hypothetical protein